MSDLISRQAAIDALGDAHFKNYGNAIMVIQALPSAEYEENNMIQIDMDMPKSCADCPCGDAQDGWCYVHNEVLERMGNGYPSTGTRPDWCPLKEVKRGKWIWTEDKDDQYGYVYKCSVCGTSTIGDSERFCGWCGARMDKDERD